MDVVERIKALCKERDITIKELEKQAGIGNGIIARWRTSNPGTGNLKKVANYFGVPSDYLLGLTDDPVDYNDPELQHIIGYDLIAEADGDVKKALQWRLAKNAALPDGEEVEEEVAVASSSVPYEDLPPEVLDKLEAYKRFLMDEWKREHSDK